VASAGLLDQLRCVLRVVRGRWNPGGGLEDRKTAETGWSWNYDGEGVKKRQIHEIILGQLH
jgi:hypothetical protein